MIRSHYNDIYWTLLGKFPDVACHLIVLFIKILLNEDSRKQHKEDCNYFRICRNLGSPIPDLTEFIRDFQYLTPLHSTYWKHVDHGPDNKILLRELKRYSCNRYNIDDRYNIDNRENDHISMRILDSIRRRNSLLLGHHGDLGQYIMLNEPHYNDIIHIGALWLGNNYSDIPVNNYTDHEYTNPHTFNKLLGQDGWINWFRLKDTHKEFITKCPPSNKYIYKNKNHTLKKNNNKRRRNYGAAQHRNHTKHIC